MVDVARAMPGAQISVEPDASDNLVVHITAGGQTADLPVNKNLVIRAGQTIELEGVVVYIAKTQKVFVPLDERCVSLGSISRDLFIAGWLHTRHAERDSPRQGLR